MKTSTSHSLCDDDDDDDGNLSENEILHIDARKNENYLIDGDSSRCRRRIPQTLDYDNDCDSLSDHDSYSDDDGDDDDDNDDKQIGDGLNELDTFFVRRKDAAVKTVTAIVWHTRFTTDWIINTRHYC